MNTPKIRFKGFTDDWEQRKVGEVTKELLDYDNFSSGLPLLTSSRSGLMYQSEYRGNATTENENTLFSVVPLNACTYRHMSDDSTFHLNINTLEKGLVSKEYPVFQENESNLKFIVQYINSSNSFTKFCTEQKKGGTRTRLYYKTLCEYKLMMPSIKEQNKTANFFDTLDHLITLHQRKCDETKQLKKFMLQKMFPKNGEKNPKIRFEGFTDDWEQRKLGALMEDGIILEQSDGNHGELYPRSEEFVNEGIPYIAASSISSDGERIDFNLTKYLSMERAIQFRKGVAKNGDVLLAHNATVGPSVMLSMDYEFAILSTSLTLYRLDKEKMSPMFFLQAIRSGYFQKQLEVFMKQTTRSQVPILTQRNLQISYPINKVEQERIGEFLSNLDHLITLHQRKCEKLKALKKFMLQNMFI